MPNTQPEPATLESIGKTVDNAKKIAAPIWGIVVFIVVGALWFGAFYQEYRTNAENGSPGVQKLISGQQSQIDGQQRQLDKLTQIVELLKQGQDQSNNETWRRLDRIERGLKP